MSEKNNLNKLDKKQKKAEKKEQKEQKKNAKDRETSRVYRVVYAIFAMLVGWWFRIRVIGQENEPEEGGFLVCGNHTAASDAVVVAYAFRKHQVRLMAKKELFKIPILAPLIRMLGAFPVDRSGKDVGAIKGAVELLKQGKCMGMFPQGHRYPAEDPRKTPVKNGAALISTRTEADVVPVFIARKDNTPKMFRRTYIIIGEKIPFESFGYDPDASGEYARITQIIFDRICTLGEDFVAKQNQKENESKKNKKK